MIEMSCEDKCHGKDILNFCVEQLRGWYITDGTYNVLMVHETFLFQNLLSLVGLLDILLEQSHKKIGYPS